MLFSLRSILAVTFLTGLAPLSVFGAPLSQVEGGIERRALPAGHKVTINGHEHTLGAAIGHPGSTATVHHVEGHPGLVAKVFHPGGSSPKDQRQEREHLDKVGEYHGHADTNGHHVVLATKHTGNTLENTHAWQHADAAGKTSLKAQASALTRARNEHHAEHHDIVHTDTNHGNVLYHEHSGVLTNAHFVDWGLAKHVTKDHDGKIDAASAAAIHRSGSKAVHGVSR